MQVRSANLVDSPEVIDALQDQALLERRIVLLQMRLASISARHGA